MNSISILRAFAIAGALGLAACSSSDGGAGDLYTPSAGGSGGKVVNQGGSGGTANKGGSGGKSSTGGSSAKGGSGGSGTSGKGGSSNYGGSGGTSSYGGSSGGDTCDDCVNSACASQASACDASPDCLALQDCYSGCGDDTCDQNCYDQHPQGAPVEEALYECMMNSCATQCGGGAGGSGAGGSGGGTGDPCGDCANAACDAQLSACYANADCAALQDCYASCADDSCYQNCYAQHPEGAPLDDELFNCACSSCPSECASAGC